MIWERLATESSPTTDSGRALTTHTDAIERRAAEPLAELGHWGRAGAQILLEDYG